MRFDDWRVAALEQDLSAMGWDYLFDLTGQLLADPDFLFQSEIHGFALPNPRRHAQRDPTIKPGHAQRQPFGRFAGPDIHRYWWFAL